MTASLPLHVSAYLEYSLLSEDTGAAEPVSCERGSARSNVRGTEGKHLRSVHV